MTQKDEYYDLAKDLDEFVKDFDSYEYQDNVDDRESHINSLHSDLKQGKFADIENTLQEIIKEDNDAEAINLLDRIKRLPSYDDNKMFYKNKKTEQYIKSIGLQLSKGLITALSDSYNKPSFNKNRVDTELQSDGKNSILDKLKVEINDFNEPLLFDDNEYYFAYDIYCNDNLIASGQDSLENVDDISDEVIAHHVMDQIGYYVSKPNIHECSKILQNCYKTCTESESGMCFLEAEFMDDYTSEDIKAFIDDIEKFKLNELCIIENYDSIEEAKKSGEAFATCYGALGSFFNNVTLEEQKETNKIKQLLEETCSLEDCEEITTSINNGIDIDLSM